MLKRLATYASFVRVSHSVFALPFALAGALLAVQQQGSGVGAPLVSTFGWILVAMVAARSAAMGFNRIADARMDALNPRTENRELPRGAMSLREATIFVVVSAAVFVYATWRLNPLCFALSPVALAIVCSGTRSRSGSRRGPSSFSGWRWRSRRWAAGWRSAGAVVRSRGSSPRPSAPGWRASTCCMRARTSSSIVRTG